MTLKSSYTIKTYGYQLLFQLVDQRRIFLEDLIGSVLIPDEAGIFPAQRGMYTVLYSQYDTPTQGKTPNSSIELPMTSSKYFMQRTGYF